MEKISSAIKPLRMPKGTTGLVEAVEKRIRHYIRTNKLREGSLLPKENEFARMFGVNRNVVREALSRLRMLGVVESKKRRGMILTTPDIFAGLERIAELGILDEKSARDLLEFRLVLELGLADLVFARKTPADIQALRAIVEKERHMENDLVLEDKLDTAFHRRLFQLTGNQPINRLRDIISSFFFIVQRHNPQLLRNKSAPTHKDLLSALEYGTAKLFREAMRRHLEVYFKIIESKLARDYPGFNLRSAARS